MATQRAGEASSLSILFNGSSSEKGFVNPNLDQNDAVEFVEPKAIRRDKVIYPSEVLESEEYTLVTHHLPVPSFTMYYKDCRMECDPNAMSMCLIHSRGGQSHKEEVPAFDHVAVHRYGSPSYPSDWFLNICGACETGLDEGKNVHIYRGRQSFCDYACLVVAILAEEMTRLVNDLCFYCKAKYGKKRRGQESGHNKKEEEDEEEEEDIFEMEDL